MDHLVDNELAQKLSNVLPNKCDIVALQRVLLELGIYETAHKETERNVRNNVCAIRH